MKKKIPSRQAQRGAIFVEAVVVVSFFTLCFLGVVFFRELYLSKLRVQRVARASAMAHAMSACKADPQTGLEKDLPGPPVQKKAPGSGTPVDLEAPGSNKGSRKADDALRALGSSRSGGLLDEITVVRLETSASATTRKDALSPKQGFESAVSSESFVTCMDPVSDDQFGDIVPRVLDVFGSIFTDK
jgi:hypothetical protein